MTIDDEALKRRVLLAHCRKIWKEVEPQWRDICELKLRVDSLHAKKAYDMRALQDATRMLEREETKPNRQS